MDKNYLVIDNETGHVRNIVVWDGVSPYAPQGATLLDASKAPTEVSFGYKIQNKKWYKSLLDEETKEIVWIEI